MTDRNEFTDIPIDDEKAEDRFLASQLPLENANDFDEAESVNAKDLIPLRLCSDVENNRRDEIGVYLQEIAKTPLLTPGEEVECFSQFEAEKQRVDELFRKKAISSLKTHSPTTL